jgi:hypothetical protein
MNQTKYISFVTGGVTSSWVKELSQHLWQKIVTQEAIEQQFKKI